MLVDSVTADLQLLDGTFFVSGTWDINGKCYNILQSVEDSMPQFIPHQQVKVMEMAINALHRFLAELYCFLYDTIDREEILQTKSSRELWNPIIHKGA